MIITDAIGRQTTVYYSYSLTKPWNYSAITVTDPTGRQIVLAYDTLDNPPGNLERTNFTPQTPNGIFAEINTINTPLFVDSNPVLLASITYPNGERMSFQYNSYGEIERINLPTGGAYEYDWDLFTCPNTSVCPQGSTGLPGLVPVVPFAFAQGYMAYHRVVKRRVYNTGGVLEQFQQFTPTESCNAPAPSGYPQLCSTTVLVAYSNAEAGTDFGHETHYFYGAPSNLYFGSDTIPATINWLKYYTLWNTTREYQTDYGPPAGSLLRKEETQWQQRSCLTSENCWFTDPVYAPPHDPRALQSIATLGSVTSSDLYCFDDYNNKTDIYEYDYGSVTGIVTFDASSPNCRTQAPAGYLRHTQTAYNTVAAYVSPSVNLVRLPLTQTLYDKSGTPRAQTKFYYDDYLAHPLTDHPKAPQHDLTFGATWAGS